MGYPHKKHSPEGGEVRRSERPRKRASRDGGDNDDDDDDEPGMSRASRRGGGGGRGSRVPSTEELLSKGETPIARCAIVLGVLEKHETGEWFAHPVSDDDVPGYSAVIEDPICFDAIRSKLEAREYGDVVDGFVADVRRVFINAFTYNWAAGNQVAEAARDCLAHFESLLPLVADVPETAPVPSVDTAGGGARKRARAPDGAPKPRRSDDVRMRHLAEFVKMCGGSEALVDGWYATTVERPSAGIVTAGTADTYYMSTDGARLRSRAEVARHLRLDYARGEAARRGKAVADREATRQAEREAKAGRQEMRGDERRHFGSYFGRPFGEGRGRLGQVTSATFYEGVVPDTTLAALPPPPAPLPPPPEAVVHPWMVVDDASAATAADVDDAAAALHPAVAAALRRVASPPRRVPATSLAPSWAPRVPAASMGDALMAADWLRVAAHALHLPSIAPTELFKVLTAPAPPPPQPPQPQPPPP
jgi:hypothetical protein